MALNDWQKISRVLPSQPFGRGSLGSLTISSSSSANPTKATASGTASSTNLSTGGAVFSNGDLILIFQQQGTGKGQWEINLVASGGGTSSLTLQTALHYSYTTGAQAIKIYEYSDFTVNNGITWTMPSWDGSTGGFSPTAVSGNLLLTGTASANGTGFRGGTGDFVSGRSFGGTGEGDAGASIDPPSSGNANGSGGGGGQSLNDAGGGGGGGAYGASASSGSSGNSGAAGGNGAASSGSADLTLMEFGGGGGGGGIDDSSFGGSGGNGGGSVIFFAKNITITGGITTTGNNGTSHGDSGGGGGGGSGGSVLLCCETADIGTNLVTANAGNGAPGNSAFGGVGGNGGNGSVGRIAVYYGSSLTGTTSPSATTAQDSSFVAVTNSYAYFL